MSDDLFGKLDSGLLGQVNESFSVADGSLDFSAPVLFVINGDVKAQKDQAPAMYYGGWATSAEKFSAILENEGRAVPKGFVKSSLVNSKGEVVEVFAARSIMVAPVVKRVSWQTMTGERTQGYVKGSRQHVQVLAILADPSNYKAWGPVILSAKGFQARNVLESFVKWQRHTVTSRTAISSGGNIPAWLFWMAIGTFGKERVQEMVGSTSKSPITPVGAALPEMTDELMQKLFGGEDLARLIVEYSQKAKEWASAWDFPTDGSAPSAKQGSTRGNQSQDDGSFEGFGF